MKRFLSLLIFAASAYAQVTSVATSCGVAGGTITTTGTISRTELLGAHNGAYTILTADCGLTLTSNVVAAWALPASGSSGFLTGWFATLQNLGTATITVTPTTSTFYGAVTGATLAVGPGAAYKIVSDGTNYLVQGTVFGTTNGQTLFGGAPPTVSACGTGAAIVAGSTNNGGRITVGSNTDGTPVVNCTLTFSATFSHAPAVSFSASTNGLQVSPIAVSTTVALLRFNADATGATVSYTAF